MRRGTGAKESAPVRPPRSPSSACRKRRGVSKRCVPNRHRLSSKAEHPMAKRQMHQSRPAVRAKAARGHRTQPAGPPTWTRPVTRTIRAPSAPSAPPSTAVGRARAGRGPRRRRSPYRATRSRAAVLGERSRPAGTRRGGGTRDARTVRRHSYRCIRFFPCTVITASIRSGTVQDLPRRRSCRRASRAGCPDGRCGGLSPR